MLNKRVVVPALCIFILAPGFLFHAFARKTQMSDLPLTPQTATLIINEYLADPAGSTAGDLEGDANGDGIRDSEDDEFVEIVNYGAAPLDIGLFTISDATQTRFTIPADKVIPPGEAAVVFGGGTPTGEFGNATANGLVFTAGPSGLSLNNSGDSIIIKDNLAVTLASVTFGSAEGGANQSITRSPDITGAFTTHSTAAGSGGALFSPGARVNGAPFTTTDPLITSISPEGTIAGADVTITVMGINFVNGSTVRLNEAPVFTAFVSASELAAQIPSSVTNVPGIYLVTVRNPGGDVSNAIPFTVLGRIGINEYLADPADGLIGDANGDGIRDSAQDEFVEIVNRTDTPADVGGFTIRDADAQRFAFPQGTIIPAGEAAVIFGGGNPQGDFGNARANGLLFTAPLSLNNSGDTIALRNSSAATVESITYGPTEGNANQSINRNPDLSGIAFAPHSSIPGSGGRLFSPGTLVDGSAFTIGPRITSITPDSAPKGAPPFDLAVLGSGFDGGSNVSIDGQLVPTTLIDAGRLIARVPANVTTAAGPHPVQVRNEGGNHSNSVTLTIIPPPPTVISITPTTVVLGGGAFTMFLSGLNFVSGAVVLIDGTPIPTTFISELDLRAAVPASFSASLGVRLVIVRNSDGRESNSTALEVIPPATVITSISPSTVITDGPSFALVVKGTNFKSGAAVLFDGTDLPTTFVSISEVSAQVAASFIAGIGVHSISVRNPGEFPSNDAVFQVLPDPPLIESLEPKSVTAGSGDITVKITGQKFQPGAVLRIIGPNLRGAVLDTLFISGENLQANVPDSITQTAGAVELGVENPDLGLSNIVTFRVLIKDPLVINEYLADPPDGPAGDANGDGTRSPSSDEFIELLNRSDEPFDISGYTLSDVDAVRHVFATGTVVPPFEAVVVFGGGTPAGPFGNASGNKLVFRASTGGLSLGNSGDIIRLRDAQGQLVQEIKFGPAQGGAGQSINRDPDGGGTTFALHTIVARDSNRLFSPGTRASGETFTIKPLVSSIMPASVRVGSLQFTLTVSGSRFLPGAVVLISNKPLPTVFRSDRQLEAQVVADLLVEGGGVDVRVRNPKGELSGITRLLITDDPPRAVSTAPQSIGTGAENVQVSIVGERFQRDASVMVEGSLVETRYVSSNSLVANVPSTLFSRASELSLLVINADGNSSNALILTVVNGPLITRMSRQKVRAGRGTMELTIGGVAFEQGVILFANDIALSTTFVNEGFLTARVTAELTNEPLMLTLQARNPNGGRSNTVRFRVIHKD